MAFTIVQLFLTLLLAAHVCMCTKQDLRRVSAGVVRQIDNLNKPIFLSLPTDVKNLDHIELRRGHSHTEVAQSNSKDNEGTRRERSITSIYYRIDVTETINSLRSNVGASDINYLTYSLSLENDAVNWTRHCDFDAQVYGSAAHGYVIFNAEGSPTDYVSDLKAALNRSNSYYALRSVELLSVGAAYSFCSDIRIGGKNYTNGYLSAYVFSSTSNFNGSVPQYKLGESCTTCRSGRYWCYQGLCKDDCSASDSNCDCNSYCLNCATTNSATCSCQCLEGWNGTRCENSDGTNATEPSCITTPRPPFTWTTKGISTVTTTKAPTGTKATTTTSNGNNVAPIGKSMIQLSLYAAMTLFLRS